MQSLQSILVQQTPGWIHKTVIQTAPAFCFLHFFETHQRQIHVVSPVILILWRHFSLSSMLCPPTRKHHSLTNRITHSALISVLRLMQQNRGAAELSQIFFFLLLLFTQQISPFACSASDKAHCWMISLSDIHFFFFFFCCLCPSKNAYSNSKARRRLEPLSYSPSTPSRIDVFSHSAALQRVVVYFLPLNDSECNEGCQGGEMQDLKNHLLFCCT